MSQTFVKSFTHLKDRPKADKALPLLQRIASLVKPVMRKHNWVLPVLSEFFPESPNLLGLNINGGQKILVRLRPAWAPDTFYDEEDIVHTMLHELTHNVHAPHDEKFYKFLSGLEEEYAALKRSGYAGEGFHAEGHRLGKNTSHNLPPHLARARALEAAEKRMRINSILNGGGRLGGNPQPSNKSPQQLAAEAAERRMRDSEACGSGALAQQEAEKAAKESVEDKVIDLTGDSDSEPEEQSRPQALSNNSTPVTNSVSTSARRPADIFSRHSPKRPAIRPDAVSSAQSSRPKLTTPPPSPLVTNPHGQPSVLPGGAWACPRCTLFNGALALQCGACLLIRPETVDPAEGWTCDTCGTKGMPHKLWTCRTCGSIKSESTFG